MRLTSVYTKRALTIIWVAFAVVLFWRGVWGLLDIYLFPNNSFLSYFISLLAGIVILYFTKKIHLTI